MSELSLEPKTNTGLQQFIGALIALILLRLLIGTVSFPIPMLRAVSLIISVLFVAIPIIGFYRGASAGWGFKSSALMVLVGGAVQVGFLFLGEATKVPWLAGMLNAISQTGLLIWTFGFGAVLGLFLRDKNLLLPMAIFLALFDIWLVFAPEGIANQAIRGTKPFMANVLPKIGFQVPAPAEVPHGGFAQPLAYVGPADWLFLAMFFVALYRFKMKTRETFLAMIPTLAAYLLVVLLFADVAIGPFRLGALPALLPIGTVILLVNRKEFKLTKDEVASTIVIVVLGISIVTWRMFVSLNAPVQLPEPLQQAPARSAPLSPSTHQPIPPA